jgi:hypothetical protein
MISRIGKLLVEATGASRLDAAQALRARDVAIILGHDPDELLARSALALVLRCYTGRVLVRANRGTISTRMVAVLEDEARRYGTPERLSVGGHGESVALGIGCDSGECFVDASGWFVSVNELGSGTAASAPAAAFGAAAGVAKLFAMLIGRSATICNERWTAPLLDFGPGEDPLRGNLDLGLVTVIGAGAIGSALAHVLRGSSWRANVTLVDYQRYDEPNHETTLMISTETALRQRPKASALAALLASENIAAQSVEEEVLAGHRVLTDRADFLVCAVDNPELRRLLDHTGARVVLNAGVGGTREDAGMVLWTRHRRDEVQLSAHYGAKTDKIVEVESGPEDVAVDECSRVAYATSLSRRHSWGWPLVHCSPRDWRKKRRKRSRR